MKTLVAGALVAMTLAVAVPAPASALGIHVGPRGVGVNVGHRRGPAFRHGYRRPLARGFHQRGFRRY